MKPILLTAAGNPENQDRGLIIQAGSRLILCIADGAGGCSGGTQAACFAADFVSLNASLTDTAKSCTDILLRMDTSLAAYRNGGETTCALAIITPDEVFGASVGDSSVWLILEEGTHEDLTRWQQRKPLIGSGSAWPVPFQSTKSKGSLLLATDGLLKYALAERIVGTCRQNPIELAAQKLIELVRYPSGALPDDVTLILTTL